MCRTQLTKENFVSTRSTLIVACFLFLNQYTQVAVADDETIAEMALIVMELKHYPSASAKAVLVAIAEASENSEVEKQIATAIANIQHKVTLADSKRLTEIIGDDSSANGARALATVVNGINHFPTKQDQEVLRSLAHR